MFFSKTLFSTQFSPELHILKIDSILDEMNLSRVIKIQTQMYFNYLPNSVVIGYLFASKSFQSVIRIICSSVT